MSTTSAIGTGGFCAHCGRPVAAGIWIGGRVYHEECTHGPGWHAQTWHPPDALPVQHYTVPMSDERVRQIVREEIQRALSEKTA